MENKQTTENDQRVRLTADEREALGWGIDYGTVMSVVETIITARQAEVADAFVAWAAKNEIAEPPLDWAWFGEIIRRYSSLHEDSSESSSPPEGRS